MNKVNLCSVVMLSVFVCLLASNTAAAAAESAAKPLPVAPAAPSPQRLLPAQAEFSSLTEVSTANEKLAKAHNAMRFAAYESSGRIVAYRVLADGLRNGSAASAELQAYVIQAITQEEKTRGRANPQIAEVKFLEPGSEFWILKSDGEPIAYDVTFMKSKDSGLDMGVNLAPAFLR